MMTSFSRICACTLVLSPPEPAVGHTSARLSWHSQASMVQSFMSTLFLSPGSWCTQYFVCALHVSVSPVLWKFCNQIPLASKVPWDISVPLPDPQVVKSVLCPRTFLMLREFLWYSCSTVCGSSDEWLFGGSNGNLLQEGLCHTLCDLGLLQSEPLLTCASTGDTQTLKSRSDSVSVEVSESWWNQGFVSALQASLASMRFDYKHDFSSLTILLGCLLCPWTWVFFFGGIQHSPVSGCSVASCNFGVSQEKVSTFPSTLLSYFQVIIPKPLCH